MSEEKCCVVTCDLPLDQTYWNNQYQANATGWDLGQVSPPIKSYIDTIENKEAKILIPGCGNAYEAEYLIQQGFTNITIIDIAPSLVENLKQRFANNKNIRVVLGDFFEHHGTYDYIIEQTFFCALPPTMRQKYVWKMHQLLSDYGKLIGLLFNREFEISPPFGGNIKEYEPLFYKAFTFNSISLAGNSIPSRANSELFFEFQKNELNQVTLYHFEGITCSGCMNTISNKFLEIDEVLNVSMNSNFSELIIVSKIEINLQKLQEIVSYDENYKIKKSK
ncbi:methyltransferase domain-containing protein [Flavobacterium sp.]|uniref:methyltransferase domain-containing protein n=1 Tax=Flavobacterium sp. TaxID=239 RepID=UPI001B705CE3|nr:methyltransferase domain-containing protein [Flavobacterium sp.]MBP6126860.1 methyltransferase domain-containing protein [Flavobacterium sp.]